MKNFLSFFTDPKKVSVAASLFCAWLTFLCTYTLPKKTPRTFTALALFALSWAILVAFYTSGPTPSPLLPTFSGFLLVYVGVLLSREALDNRPGFSADQVSSLHVLALTILITVIGPPTYKVVFGDVLFNESAVSPLNYVPGTFVTIIGFWCVWLGLRRFYEQHARHLAVSVVMGLVLGAYAVVELLFLWRYWQIYEAWAATPTRNMDDLVMPPGFKFAFAILKVVFTVLFLWLVRFSPIVNESLSQFVNRVVNRLKSLDREPPTEG